MKKYLVRYLLLGVGVFLAVSVIISLYPIPIRVLTEYPLHSLLEEGQMMHECAECHEGENFHSCDTCHNHHGSATIETTAGNVRCRKLGIVIISIIE